MNTPCKFADKTTPQGYGSAPSQNHRCVWVKEHGKPPPGMDVDHVCHNEDASCPGGVTCRHRACYELTHLRLATRRDNVTAGNHTTEAQRRLVAVHGWATKRDNPEQLTARNQRVATGMKNAWEAEKDGKEHICHCGFPAVSERSLKIHQSLKHRRKEE